MISAVMLLIVFMLFSTSTAACLIVPTSPCHFERIASKRPSNVPISSEVVGLITWVKSPDAISSAPFMATFSALMIEFERVKAIIMAIAIEIQAVTRMTMIGVVLAMESTLAFASAICLLEILSAAWVTLSKLGASHTS